MSPNQSLYFISAAQATSDKRAYPSIPFTGKAFGPNENIAEVQTYVNTEIDKLKLTPLYQAVYLGYYELYPTADLETNILPSIPGRRRLTSQRRF